MNDIPEIKFTFHTNNLIRYKMQIEKIKQVAEDLDITEEQAFWCVLLEMLEDIQTETESTATSTFKAVEDLYD